MLFRSIMGVDGRDRVEVGLEPPESFRWLDIDGFGGAREDHQDAGHPGGKSHEPTLNPRARMLKTREDTLRESANRGSPFQGD